VSASTRGGGGGGDAVVAAPSDGAGRPSSAGRPVMTRQRSGLGAGKQLCVR
jgi:hypothetical protein